MGKKNIKPKKQNSKAKVQNKGSENAPNKISAKFSDYIHETEVHSLARYIESIIELTTKDPGEYIFRGQSREDWPVNCGTQRQCEDQQFDKKMFLEKNKNLVAKIRADGHGYFEGRELNDFEILAQLQHYGAATMLIDFTRKALTALWFACNENQDKDGAVYACNTLTNPLFKKCEEFSFSIFENDSENQKNIFTNSDFIHYWEPSKLNQRFYSQDSFLIFGVKTIPNAYLYKITIKHDCKETVLKELKLIDNIDELSIYNDIYGFAQANKYTKNDISNNTQEFSGITDFQAFSRLKIAKSLSEDNKRYDLTVNELNKLETEIKISNNIQTNLKQTILQTLQNNRGHAETRLADGEKNEEYKITILKNAEKDFDESLRGINSDKIKKKLLFSIGTRGYVKLALGKDEEAIKDFDYVIKKGENKFEFYANRGYAKLRINKYEEALKDFNSAIERLELMSLEKLPASPYTNRGFIYLSLNKYHEAIIDLEKADSLKSDDENINGHIGLAKMFLGLETNDFNLIKNSLRFYNKAIDCNQNLSQWYGRRAYVSFLLRDFDNAEKDLIKAMNINPDDIHSHEGLMEIQKITGGPDIILNICQDAIIKDPESPFIFFILGKTYNALNKKEKAKEALKEAITFAQKQDKHYYILYQSKKLLEKISE